MHRGIVLQKEHPILKKPKMKQKTHTTHASGWGFWHNKDLMEAHMGWGSVLGFSFCLPHLVLQEQSAVPRDIPAGSSAAQTDSGTKSCLDPGAN